ncbi:SusC/RagA family TonB-linked outer membrane protein [Pedobacter sp. AW31-3R]|uniref:SusC/RagA family TonB-linked outer membrane protein n=1 Tax=Pedobacter sp. AW31-3R TaxID=3445781 RepID=UPI003F9F0884
MQFNIYSFSFFLSILSSLAFSSLAQSPEIKTMIRGKITDYTDHRPVPGVSVVEVDKNRRTVNGVSTDREGNFALKVSDATNSVSISFIGYKTLTLKIGSRSVFNLEITAEENALTEVTISAGKSVDSGNGLPVEEKNRTTAVATISAKAMEEMVGASIDQQLQGRLSGVDIAAESGNPGAGMQIRIRGTSSINAGTNPLIVVDGMPYETTISDDFNFGTADEQGYAQLLNIAPSDISEISVLKDAAATAVWGSRAANGVLLITTKRGTIGKPVLTYTFKGSVSRQPDGIPMLSGDQYSQLIPEAYMNRTGAALNTSTYKEFSYDVKDPYWYYNYSNNTDWVKEITQTGVLQDHNISVSGGGERAKYFASMGYFKQGGTVIGTDLERITTRINLDYNVSDRLRFRTDVAYTHVVNNQPYSNTIREVAYKKMPNMSVYEYDIYGNQTPNYFSPEQNIQGYFFFNSNGAIRGTYNPVAMALAAKNVQAGERIVPKFNIQYTLVPSLLKLSTDVQFDINTQKTNSFLPQIATGRPFTETTVNRAGDRDYDTYSVQTKTNLLYTPTLGPKHSLSGALSFQTSDLQYVDQQILTSNTASSYLQDVSSESRTQSDGLYTLSSQIRRRSIGAIANVQYGFMGNRYILNAAVRMDGDSRFGPANRFGYFPSLSGRWRISDENFLKKATFIDDLSLRLSYGQVGNTPRYDYTFYNTYSNYTWNYMGLSGVYSSNIELKNLKWETVTGKNIGLNLILLKNRINLDVDVYRNRTTDMIYPDLQLMSSSGFQSVDLNVGTMDNQGWELSIFTTPLKTKKWEVGFNFNISHNENIIRSISSLYPRESTKSVTENGVYKSYLQENNPFGSFYGFRYKGVYSDKDATVAKDANGNQLVGLDGEKIYMRFNYPAVDYVFQPGDAVYEDINHDGVIDYRDVVYLGNSNPKFSGGFGTNITYGGNLTLLVFFSYRYGNSLINGTKITTTNMSTYDNQSTAVLRRWKNEGDVTDIPRAVIGTGYNWLGSDRYVEDGSFLRLRSVTAKYNLDQKLAKRLGMLGASLYFTAENLLTWTNYTGQDPEVAIRITNAFSTVTDNSLTPPVKTFTLGLSARF